MPKQTDNTTLAGRWIESFRSGKQTDSNGVTTNFTHDDLDQMVETTRDDRPFPNVIGHPDDTAPAFGWGYAAKRVGDVLYTKHRDIDPNFDKAVKNKNYPNRSLSLYKDPDNGGKWTINHLGWLGGKAPAVEGLALAFSAAPSRPDVEMHEYKANMVWEAGYSIGVIGTLLRNLKNKFIDDDGIETADQLIPEYMLEGLRESSATIKSKPDNAFSKPEFKPEPKPNGDTMPREYTQAEIDALIAQAKQDAVDQTIAEFSQQLDDKDKQHREFLKKQLTQSVATQVGEWVESGQIKKAEAGDVKSFMMHLGAADDGVAATFEFSKGDGSKKLDAVGWFSEFVASRKPVLQMKKTPNGTAGDESHVPTPAEIKSYMKDNNCGAAEASYALSNAQDGE